jgi:hypothetical protein
MQSCPAWGSFGIGIDFLYYFSLLKNSLQSSSGRQDECVLTKK